MRDRIADEGPEPLAGSATSGAPPRRPPTAVGMREPLWPFGGRRVVLHSFLPVVLRQLQAPTRDLVLPSEVVAALEAAGIVTLAHLVGLADTELLLIPGVDRATVDAIRRRLWEVRSSTPELLGR